MILVEWRVDRVERLYLAYSGLSIAWNEAIRAVAACHCVIL